MVAFEGLQPMVTEAFMKENEKNQRGLGEEIEQSNGSWKALINCGHQDQKHWFCSSDLCNVEALEAY